MSIQIIDKIKPLGNFPAVDAVDVDVNGIRLDAVLSVSAAKIEKKIDAETVNSTFAKKTEIPVVPANVSAFTNDAGYLTQHQSLANYALKSEIPTVPTNVSAFTNDAGYIKFVTPSMFGAVGDGETDDTEAMQNAVDYACDNGMAVYINANINVTETIVLNNNTSIVSDGLHTISCSGGVDGNGMPTFGGVDLKNIVFDNVKIENTGFGNWSDEFGVVGSYEKYGACIALGRCENITIRNCRLFKAGGYKGQYENIGFCLWLSACKNAVVDGNLVECGHHGIVLDRWFADETHYNMNVNICNNLVHTFSSKGIIYEGSGKSVNISISGNRLYNCAINFIEGRSWMNLTIANNSMTNSPLYRTNPATEYGLSGAGWKWDTTVEPGIAMWCVAGYSENVIIANNNVEYGSFGVLIPCIFGCTVTGNNFNHITNNCLNITGAAVAEASFDAVGHFIVSNNNFGGGEVGALISNSHPSLKLENVIISDNICKSGMLCKIYNCEKVTVRGNWGGKHGLYQKSKRLEIHTVVEGNFDVFEECDDIQINNNSYNTQNGIQFKDCSNIRGELVTDASVNVVSTRYPATSSGRLKITYIGAGHPTNWQSSVTDIRIDAYSLFKPVGNNHQTGSTWTCTGDYPNGKVFSVFKDGIWYDLLTIPEPEPEPEQN